MTNAELLAKIKIGLGITTSYQDDTLQVYIDDVKAFMVSAGVKQSVIESTASVGCILRGVADLWNYGSGNATFSEYFRMRVIQLSVEDDAEIIPNMEMTVYVPEEDETTSLGWGNSVLGIFKQVSAREFNVTDTEIAKAVVICADGTTYTGENNGTGNRRSIEFGGKRIMLMPSTKYDTEQAKFVDNVGTTIISCPVPLCYGAEIKLSTYDKE